MKILPIAGLWNSLRGERSGSPSRFRARSSLPLMAAVSVGLLAPPAAAQYYRSNAEIGTLMQAAETSHPTLCKRYILGNSFEGRPIWALRISDNIGVDEDEPEFKYISSMHGDEIIGVEMCLHLIDEITTNYGLDPQITNIVDEVDLWIVPLMNPDGYERVPRTRYNAQGIDLNRNFPEGTDGEPNTPTGRATEVQVIMNWSFGQSFTLAANFHGGALVVNYPFDNDGMGSVFSPTPDEDLFVYISEEYSSHNLPLWNSTTFFHGITNGAEWYSIDGGMQDWDYRYTGGNEVTIELGENKQPPASQIPVYWGNNRDSMLAYIDTCLIGVRGIVTDADTGDPLPATVVVVGRDHPIYTDPDVGDYHRMLLPGTYDLTYEADGYDVKTIGGVDVLDGPATRVDVTLSPPPLVVAPNGGELLEMGVPVMVSWTVNDPTAQFHVRYSANAGETTSVFDGFESGALDAAYTTGGHQPWFVASGTVHTGTRAARAGDISDSQESWMTRTAFQGPLSFWYRVSSESGYDHFKFYVDGAVQVNASGNVTWTLFSTSLPAGEHELKWEYKKDGSVSSGSDTVWVDDLQLVEDLTAWADIIALTDVGASSTQWTPLVPSESCKVAVRAYYGNGYGNWDASDDVFSVVGSIDPIPTVSQWGMAIMTCLILMAATITFRRRALARSCGGARPATTTAVGKTILCLALSVPLAHRAFAAGEDEAWTIHAAAMLGKVEKIDALLADDPELVNAKDDTGATPLHMAAKGLKAAAARRLVEAGADVNAKDAKGATPLHFVALAGGDTERDEKSREAIVELLLAQGADAKAPDAYRKTPLHFAIVRRRANLFEPLRAAGASLSAPDHAGRTPLHDAALTGDPAAVKWLLAHEAPLGPTDRNGDTPLHLAAGAFRVDVVRLLLEAGAEVDARNTKGGTPLLAAASALPEGVPEVDDAVTAVAKMLLKQGADVNAQDEEGNTPISRARQRDHPNLAGTLEEAAEEAASTPKDTED